MNSSEFTLHTLPSQVHSRVSSLAAVSGEGGRGRGHHSSSSQEKRHHSPGRHLPARWHGEANGDAVHSLTHNYEHNQTCFVVNYLPCYFIFFSQGDGGINDEKKYTWVDLFSTTNIRNITILNILIWWVMFDRYVCFYICSICCIHLYCIIVFTQTMWSLCAFASPTIAYFVDLLFHSIRPCRCRFNFNVWLMCMFDFIHQLRSSITY